MKNNYTNSELRKLTKTDLEGSWGTAIILLILMGVITSIISNVLSGLTTPANLTSNLTQLMLSEDPDLIMAQMPVLMNQIGVSSTIAGNISSTIAAIFALGVDFGFLNLIDGKGLKVEDLIGGFNKNIGKNILVVVVKSILISIGFVLFIIPGIILSYMFMPISYILKEEPDLDIGSIFKKSAELMKGHKFNYFKAALPFYLIPTLALLALGIAGAILIGMESIGLGISLILVGFVVSFILVFVYSIKLLALPASYYRRKLAPISNSQDSEEDFISYEEAGEAEENQEI